MIFRWLNDEECEVRLTESGDVVLGLHFDQRYVRWETQAWPNDILTNDDLWEEVDLDDADVRERFQLDRERAAMFPEGAARSTIVTEYRTRLDAYVSETRDLAIQVATRRARQAARCDCGYGDERYPGAEHDTRCPLYRGPSTTP